MVICSLFNHIEFEKQLDHIINIYTAQTSRLYIYNGMKTKRWTETHTVLWLDIILVDTIFNFWENVFTFTANTEYQVFPLLYFTFQDFTLKSKASFILKSDMQP